MLNSELVAAVKTPRKRLQTHIPERILHSKDEAAALLSISRERLNTFWPMAA
jgi:hypothetical protein